MTRLPAISEAEFRDTVVKISPEPLAEAAISSMQAHYEELRRWAPRLALIGPGTAQEVVQRHFGEALAGLPWIPPEPPENSEGEILDIGSGAGFPGLVLAAARPAWRVTLVEARQKKWAFLMSVVRKASLSCRCLNARVGDPLPAAIPRRLGLVTARAIRLPAADLGLLLGRLEGAEKGAGQGLFWAGADDPEVPEGYGVETLTSLPGSEARRIVSIRRRAPTTAATDPTSDLPTSPDPETP